MAKEIIKSDWYSELSRLARSDQMSNFVNAELNSASIIASVRWKSYTFSKVASLISREHGYSSISMFNAERMLKLIFDHESRIVYDRIVESVNDAVVGAWSRYGWLKRQSAIADNIFGLICVGTGNGTGAYEIYHGLFKAASPTGYQSIGGTNILIVDTPNSCVWINIENRALRTATLADQTYIQLAKLGDL